MKLVVQIPCHNEAENLPKTLAALPESVDGIDEIEVVVVDDGSDDATAEIARAHGVAEVVRHARRRGLARAFRSGLEASLRRGADIVVNTDGDNQYEGEDIPALVQPILEGRADIVVGDRDAGSLAHFSFIKRRLQRIGSWTMRKLSQTDVADAPSGFRAYSREAALRLNVMTEFTYTLETLIQAGKRGLAVVDVAIRARETERASRLARSTGHYLANAGITMIRAYALYEPLKIFSVLGAVLMFGGFMLGVRYLYFLYVLGVSGDRHIQSLILAAILSIVGFLALCLALLADLLAGNRKLMEEMLYRLRRLELGEAGDAAGAEARTLERRPTGDPVTASRADPDSGRRGE